MTKQELPKTRNWVVIVLILLALYLISAIFANFATLFNFEEIKQGNVAIIPIKGLITSESGKDPFGRGGISSSDIIDMIETAAKNEDIKAVILEINSPGGSAVASEEIARAVSELNKTSVAWIREVGASGAYWIASASDHIVASRMSMTGSIGVISSYLEFAELLERFNVTYRRLVAGKYKDTGSPFKKLTKEEEEIIQQKLDKVHKYFIEDVALNRKMTKEKLTEFATGMVYLGGEALEIGLIDEIGSKQEAINYIEIKHNITVETVSYEKEKSLLDILTNLISNHGYSTGLGFNDALIVRT